MPRRVTLPVREFKAFSACPRCEKFGHFDIVSPPAVDTVWESSDDEFEEIKNAYGETLITIRNKPRGYQTDESTCDVVRTCHYCNARWGEK